MPDIWGCSYLATLSRMSTGRVTVSMPEELRSAASEIAKQLDLSFSAVVTAALGDWMRGRLVDAWLAEHQATHGPFDEAELQNLAAEAGVPYLAPGRFAEPAV